MFASPVIAAPMAGGTTTATFALATQRAGALAFAAGGYKSAAALAEHLAPLRSAGTDFGVNLFLPPREPLDPGTADALERYRSELLPEAARLGASVPDLPFSSDDPRVQDYWAEKLDLLLKDPVPLVSFTFGLAPAAIVADLQRVGSRVLASVTSVAEALAAEETGVDALVVQHSNAGGHCASFLPQPRGAGEPSIVELIAAVRAAVGLPLVAAGGIGDAATAKAALTAGAVAVQLGTALLRTDESGARALHKAALADPKYTTTALTRAFTGRPARALVNDFVRSHANAPDAYPEVHLLTGPLRAAAADAGDPEALNLWAGTAWQKSQDGPVGTVIAGFLDEL
ncbi:nitronate monooxygenase [Arthrobacter sp. GMC3]|uniref:nitronate monooxygenase n=1 Tax=Arthrobacter sp. GMC3 TaxID=2058894 RepID=UPI000CE3C11C|nr:nitronate monooxygenase [Arthrobacter sp. GMC3]